MLRRALKAEQTLEPQSDKHPFLFRFAEPQRAKLAAMADKVTFEKDDIVLVAGEHSTHFYLLVSRQLVLVVSSAGRPCSIIVTRSFRFVHANGARRSVWKAVD